MKKEEQSNMTLSDCRWMVSWLSGQESFLWEVAFEKRPGIKQESRLYGIHRTVQAGGMRKAIKVK